MRQWVIIAIGLLFFGATARAIPARGVPITVTQADGTTLTIVVHGDEYSSWASTVDGYQIVQKEGIYYYYEPQSSRSGAGLKASDPATRGTAEVWGLTGRFRGQMDAGGVDHTRRMTYPLLEQLSASKATTNPNPVTGPTQSLVLLVQFSDVAFAPKNVLSVFSNLLNTGPTSARQYFSDNSKGRYSPTFDVKGPYTLPHPMAYYGAKSGSLSDKDPQQMVIDACKSASREVDFSRYDENKDGRVDNVYIIYAGVNEAESGGGNTIWPHRWTLQNKPDTRFNGVQVWDYACGSELSINTSTLERNLAGIGTFCHEFSHVLGLPDFYDTDQSVNGESVGLYHFSVMGRGNYNNQGHTPPYYTALERWLLGWGTLQELKTDQQITLTRVEEQLSAWYIPTSDPGEFYIIEARGSRLWDAYLGGTGLLVYHIDRSNAMINSTRAIDRWKDNTVNSVATHPCVRLIESGGTTLNALMGTISAGKVFYPGSDGVNSFTGRSYGGVDWRGNAVGVELIDVVNANGAVSLATRASQGTGLPLSFQASQRSVVVRLSPALYNDHESSSRYYLEVKTEGKIGPKVELKQNPTLVTVQGLSPDTPYTATLSVTPNASSPEELAEGKFTTPSLSAPYPAITGLKSQIARGSTVLFGTTNLAAPATKITFSVNGAGLEKATYTFSSAGQYTVGCTISYASGETEVIKRVITVTQ